MKFISFWMKKQGHGRPGHVPYTDRPRLVVEVCHNAIRILYPGGQIKRDLAEYYEVVDEG